MLRRRLGLLSRSKEYTEKVRTNATSSLIVWNLKVNEDKTSSETIKREKYHELETWRKTRKLGSLLGDSEDMAKRQQLAAAAFSSLNTGRAWTNRRISSPKTQVAARHSIPRHNPQRRSIQAHQVGPTKRRATSSQMANVSTRSTNERQRACQTSDALLLPHRKHKERASRPTENDAACNHRQRPTGHCKSSQEARPEEEHHQSSSE